MSLKLVTTGVGAVCQTHERLPEVGFGQPVTSPGNARTAKSPRDGLVGARGSPRTTKQPLVRSYLLGSEIEAAMAKAATAGSQIALPPMEVPRYGECQNFAQGDVEHRLWQDKGKPR